jgi:ABC-type branched-subunit amino acid transport system ATPase component
MPIILNVHNLTKKFGGLVAVRECSFKVKRKGITCLVGPNGAGKTTIFNLITAVLEPTEGTVYLNNNNLKGVPAHKIVRKGIARTFQDIRQFNELTVLENVMIAEQKQKGESIFDVLLQWGSVKKQDREVQRKAKKILKFVGLDDMDSELAKNLSHAQQKLLSIARILMTDAELLLFDEPTSGLDHESLDRVLELMKEMSIQGKTILLVEHNMDVVRRVGDELIFLHQGHVLACGSYKEISGDSDLTQIYFGDN